MQRVGDLVRNIVSGPDGTAFIIHKTGGTQFIGSAQQFAEFQISEIDKTKRIVKLAHIPVE